jgi:hypothetical protein
MALTMADTWRLVTGGVDTQLDLNVVAVLDTIGVARRSCPVLSVSCLAATRMAVTEGGHRSSVDS